MLSRYCCRTGYSPHRRHTAPLSVDPQSRPDGRGDGAGKNEMIAGFLHLVIELALRVIDDVLQQKICPTLYSSLLQEPSEELDPRRRGVLPDKGREGSLRRTCSRHQHLVDRAGAHHVLRPGER